MSVIKTFINKRIKQLLQEYKNPERVIEQLAALGQAKDREESQQLARFVYDVFNESRKEKESLFDIPPSFFGNEIELNDYFEEDTPGFELLKENPGKRAGFRGDNPEIINELAEIMEQLENECRRKIDLEEDQSLDRIAGLSSRWTSPVKDVENFPIVRDLILLLEYIDAQGVVYSNETDGEDHYLKVFRELKGSFINTAKYPSSEETGGRYVFFLVEIGLECRLIKVSDRGELRVSTGSGRALIGKSINFHKLFNEISVKWWLYFRDFFFKEKNQELFIPEEFAFAAIPFLVSGASRWNYQGEVSFPFFVRKWQDMVVSNNNGRDRNYEIEVFRDISASVNREYLLSYYFMGFLECKIDGRDMVLVKLTEPGYLFLTRIYEKCTPLIRSYYNFQACNTLLECILVVSSMIPDSLKIQNSASLLDNIYNLSSQLESNLDKLFYMIIESGEGFCGYRDAEKESLHSLHFVEKLISEYKKSFNYEKVARRVFGKKILVF